MRTLYNPAVKRSIPLSPTELCKAPRFGPLSTHQEPSHQESPGPSEPLRDPYQHIINLF